MPISLRRLMALIPLLVSFGAHAFGFGEVAVSSHLGEPLRASVPVSLDEGTAFLDHCARLVGPALHHPDLGRAQIDVINRDGRHYVTISTDRPVNDPVLEFTLRTEGCGPTMQKDFVILLSPNDANATPPHVVAAPLAAPDTGSRRAEAAAPVGRRRAVSPPAKPRHRSTAQASKAPVAAASVATPPPEPRIVAPVAPAAPVQAMPEPAPELAAPAPAEQAPASPDEPAVEPAPAAPRTWSPYLWLPVALVLAALVALWLKRRERHYDFQNRTLPAMPSSRRERPRPVASQAAARTQPELTPALAPTAATAMRPARPATARPEPPAAIEVGKPNADGIEAKTIQPSDFGVNSVAAFDHVMELAEVMLAFGRSGQAIDALRQHIRDNPRQSVDPWLKLLELYHQSNQRAEFDALAADLHKYYNVAIADWSDYAASPVAGPLSLESLPHVMARLSTNWGSQACLDYINHLLLDNRGGQRLGFALDIVRDILMLRNVLRELNADAASAV
ncbi:hypothetical protein EZJ19_13735 [Parasulfuritortus cantonensis]|uniref:FimV N-terminal domain-containing protein n=1 Tax=Parasulfuritortus cantonensis TaxID=2528202 RepID=A0A4V2NV25_9PROT|nr:hypothetical protein [Parasulfuritortus cantonensis]TCJ11866.1 hypothetical protein EZJ19_13735 [Parasulfuritortus cantonensis]